VLAAALVIVLPSCHRTPGGSGKPNLILIVTDDQRWDSLSAMPNVQRLLGAHGVTFSNAFVTTSLCCPSRASILTGEYSRHTGVYSDVPPNGGAPSFKDRSTLATWLQGGGYATGLVGKYLNSYTLLGPGYVPPGWNTWDAIASVPIVNYYDYTLNENGKLVRYGRFPWDYSTLVLEGLATRFIQQARSPYFLYYAPIAPHLPATPAPSDLNRFRDLPPYRSPSLNEADVSDKPWASQHPPLTATQVRTASVFRDRILASLQAVDRSVAAIVQAVADRGQLGNTVIGLISDNGFLLGEHRLYLQKIWPYEESIRVPLVFRVPWLATGRTDAHMVLNIDLASTFAELAGLRPGLPQDGRSLVPLLRGEPVAWRTDFVEEFLGRDQSFNGGPPPFEAIRTERYLYVRYGNGWREVYDLKADPHELSNLAGRPSAAAVQAALARQLAELLRE
jgi:arylsulfatase A-like enzyme